MLFKLLQCEQIKLKRTWIFVMSILIPFAINFLLTIDLHYRYTGYFPRFDACIPRTPFIRGRTKKS
jgi:hypothetical protein